MLIKKMILKTLKKRGVSLQKNEELDKMSARSKKSYELISELGYLSRSRLTHLPETIPETVTDCLTRLIGTSPYEGLSIVDALYETRDIGGSVCELGVAQGATSRMIASVLLLDKNEKDLCIFDSFQGLSQPTEFDTLKDDIYNLGEMSAYGGLMSFGKKNVLTSLNEVAFPESRIQLFEGYIDEVVISEKARLPEKVSFAYVDFDLYAPIIDGLKMLESRISLGGIIIVDDYDYFSTGAKKAVDEFMTVHSDEYSITIPEKSLGHFAVIKRMNVGQRKEQE